MNDKLIEKLRKLLALAGNNPSQAEAELAMSKAQAMALEHGIDLALIGQVTDEDDSVIQEHIEMGQRLPTVNTFITNVLTKFFNVRIILSGSRESGRRLIFVGKRDSIDTAKYIYTWLGDTMVRCWKKYYHNTPGINLNDKQSYLFGFYNGLVGKLDRNRKEVEASKITNDSDRNKYAVACVNLNQQIQSFIDDAFPSLRKTATKSIRVNADSYSRGMADGNNCNIAKGGIAPNKVAGVIAA